MRELAARVRSGESVQLSDIRPSLKDMLPLVRKLGSAHQDLSDLEHCFTQVNTSVRFWRLRAHAFGGDVPAGSSELSALLSFVLYALL